MAANTDVRRPRRPRPEARPRTPPDHIGMSLAAVLLALSGWAGLYLLITTAQPYAGPRWLFFVLLHIAVSGTVLPIVRYLNVRFTPVSRPLPPSGVIVRQSVWVGLFVVTCAWLRMPRALNWGIAFFIALAFIVVEVFLRLRENADPRQPG
jgi:hypothetical protein